MTKQKSKNKSPKVERPGRHSISFDDPSLTQQQFKQSVDVNNIVNHYKNTGVDPYESRKQSMHFGDATSKSFTEAMYQVSEVNSAFHNLTAKERQSFSNDPSQWLTSLEGAYKAQHEIVPPPASEDVSEPPPPPEDTSEGGEV